MKFSKLGAVKFVVSGVVGIGTGKIVNQFIKGNVTAESKFDKAAIFAASWVIGAMATEATKKQTDSMIDDVVKQYNDFKQAVDLGPRLGRIQRNESTFEAEGLDPSQFTKNDEGKLEPLKVEGTEDYIRVTISK